MKSEIELTGLGVNLNKFINTLIKEIKFNGYSEFFDDLIRLNIEIELNKYNETLL